MDGHCESCYERTTSYTFIRRWKDNTGDQDPIVIVAELDLRLNDADRLAGAKARAFAAAQKHYADRLDSGTFEDLTEPVLVVFADISGDLLKTNTLRVALKEDESNTVLSIPDIYVLASNDPSKALHAKAQAASVRACKESAAFGAELIQQLFPDATSVSIHVTDQDGQYGESVDLEIVYAGEDVLWMAPHGAAVANGAEPPSSQPTIEAETLTFIESIIEEANPRHSALLDHTSSTEYGGWLRLDLVKALASRASAAQQAGAAGL